MRRLLFMMFISITFLLLVSNITMAYEKEIKSLSASMAENIAKAGKKTIAVVDFTDLQGNVTELGRFLAEEFSVALAGTNKGFEVVDRTHLKSILAEHKLSATGIIDPQTARKLGQIAGVDTLITGTITPFGDSVRLSVKVLATDTAKIIDASSGDIAKTKAIEELLARGIESAQPFSQTSTTSYISSTSNSKSKTVGPFVVAMKKMIVSSEGEVRLILDFYNQSDKTLPIIEDHFGNPNYPKLTDEKGNTYEYSRGRGDLSNQLILNPKSNSNVVLYFEPKSRKNRDININERIGSVFAVNIPFLLNEKTEYSVSFTDIKAQMPK